MIALLRKLGRLLSWHVTYGAPSHPKWKTGPSGHPRVSVRSLSSRPTAETVSEGSDEKWEKLDSAFETMGFDAERAAREAHARDIFGL